MKRAPNLSRVGYFGGFLFALLSAIRYYWFFYDLDRLIFYTLLGIVIMAISFLYQRVRENTIGYDAMSEQIEILTRWKKDIGENEEEEEKDLNNDEGDE